jgi:hypothetical protein
MIPLVGPDPEERSPEVAQSAGERASPRRRWPRWLLAAIGVIGLLALVVTVLRGMRESAWQDMCRNNLQQIGLALANYQNERGCLPPAFVTGADGKPTLSWRVLAAEYIWYDLDFRARMDFSQPWDSPANAGFLAGFEPTVYRCPSSGEPAATITNYVAVVGPGTAWEAGEGPLLLVVEWPDSDIHWAEPRDLTVEEFLEWFRQRPGRSDSLHPGFLLYIDTRGDAHELPTDAAPEEVRKLLVGPSSEPVAAR